MPRISRARTNHLLATALFRAIRSMIVDAETSREDAQDMVMILWKRFPDLAERLIHEEIKSAGFKLEGNLRDASPDEMLAFIGATDRRVIN